MTGLAGASSSSLPSVAPGAIPASVRARGPEAEDTYRAALGFERVLLGQLTEAMRSTANEESGGQYADLAGDALADALAAGGGIGLAENLVRSMHPHREAP